MPSISSTQDTNIWIAAGEGRIDLVEYFLLNGGPDITDLGNPNVKDELGYTCMHAAASYDQKEMVEYLISKGADVNILDHEGDTPLHVTETASMAELLIANGADPHIRNSEGFLPIETASEQEFDQVVQILKAYTPEYRIQEIPSDLELQQLVLDSVLNQLNSQS
jgi:ankyrin repeat protein